MIVIIIMIVVMIVAVIAVVIVVVFDSNFSRTVQIIVFGNVVPRDPGMHESLFGRIASLIINVEQFTEQILGAVRNIVRPARKFQGEFFV